MKIGCARTHQTVKKEEISGFTLTAKTLSGREKDFFRSTGRVLIIKNKNQSIELST